MKIKKILIMLIGIVLLGCQTKNSMNIDQSEKLKLNPVVTTGELDNGLTYFVQENTKPENRIELRLVVKAGSMQENNDQVGLAHFVEHMAFNGTEKFPKDKLVKYLESIGMAFGPEINAYTSFDETVYMLSIPADDPEILDNALLILREWAHAITFEDEEIEKERGVIVEEWRGGRGVDGRYRDQILPILLKNSRYATRLPIGDMDIIKNCDPQKLRDFYNDWYRPELMSVIVVGSINTNEIVNKINNQFSFTNKTPARDKKDNSVPVKARTLVDIFSDPEMTYTGITYFIKRDGTSVTTQESYSNLIKDLLAILMFNKRMEEIYTKPDSPFLYAGGGFSEFVKPLDLTSFSVQVNEGESLAGFEALLDEIEKVKQNGFTQAELNRAIEMINMIMTNQFNERENIENSSVVNELVDYIVGGSTPMGIEAELEILNIVLEDINLENVNKRAVSNYSGEDRFVSVVMPENKEIESPLSKDFISLFSAVENKNFIARVEEEISSPLFTQNLDEKLPLNSEYNATLDITTLTLENGVKVILKPTNFKADEIILSATSLGGLSHVEDSEYVSGLLATSLVESSGLNGFDAIELGKLLSGKNVGISPWIGNKSEGLSGSSSVEDFETLLQLTYLYFVKPEFSQESYEVIMNNVSNYLSNKDNSPNTIFSDRITELLGNGHFRYKPLTLKSLEEVDYTEIVNIYLERFRNIKDFTFVFTGSFNPEEITPVISKYLSSIPGTDEIEEALDLGIRTPDKVVEEVISRGLEDKSRVEVIYSGDFTGTTQDELSFSLLSSYLEEELRVLIREDLSGTYGVSVFSSVENFPNREFTFGFSFGCEPGRESELTQAAFALIDKLKNGTVVTEGVEAVINNFTRSMELNLKDNQYWSDAIIYCVENSRDMNSILDLDLSYVTKDKFIELSNTYLNNNRYIYLTLKPEV